MAIIGRNHLFAAVQIRNIALANVALKILLAFIYFSAFHLAQVISLFLFQHFYNFICFFLIIHPYRCKNGEINGNTLIYMRNKNVF